MKLRMYHPINEVNQLNRGFEDFMNEIFGKSSVQSCSDVCTRAPRVNISEDDNHYFLNLDLPGMKKEDVKIILKNDMLEIEGDRKIDEKNWLRREISSGKVIRNFQLPDDVDTSKIDARFLDGVLTVSLSKKEEIKPREILIDVK